MKNKMRILSLVAVVLFSSSVIADKSGDIVISLTVGGSETNDGHITGSLVDNKNFELQFNNSTGQIVENNDIGNLNFTGLNLEANYICSVKFESDYLSNSGAFELRETNYEANSYAIAYRLSAYGTTTTSTGTDDITQGSLRNGEKIIAEANNEGNCIVDITRLRITHSGQPLIDKKGSYSGTLNYTLSFDSADSI